MNLNMHYMPIPKPEKCANCGACPTCGQYQAPYGFSPVYPIWSQPTYPLGPIWIAPIDHWTAPFIYTTTNVTTNEGNQIRCT